MAGKGLRCVVLIKPPLDSNRLMEREHYVSAGIHNNHDLLLLVGISLARKYSSSESSEIFVKRVKNILTK